MIANREIELQLQVKKKGIILRLRHSRSNLHNSPFPRFLNSCETKVGSEFSRQSIYLTLYISFAINATKDLIYFIFIIFLKYYSYSK